MGRKNPRVLVSSTSAGRQEVAGEAAVSRGYHRTQVITPDVEAVTADLDPYRIRLYVDESHVVVRVGCG
jgi:hypothetical protein